MKKALFVCILSCMIMFSESCKTTTVVEKPKEPALVAKPPRPKPDYVWIDGEWYKSGSKYEFRQGYWAPPKVGHAWVKGHWEQRKGGWYWEKGHWD